MGIKPVYLILLEFELGIFFLKPIFKGLYSFAIKLYFAGFDAGLIDRCDTSLILLIGVKFSESVFLGRNGVNIWKRSDLVLFDLLIDVIAVMYLVKADRVRLLCVLF
jgi:hypothetical protein